MPKCKITSCNIKNALFNLPDEQNGICCAKHKEENMVNIVDKKCIFKGYLN